MIKNMKKRSVSESEVTEKSADAAGNLNKVLKKKKIENKSVQNGQDKQIKKDAPKNVKTGMKKDKKSLNVSKNNEKQVVNDKQNQLKSTGDAQGQAKKRAYPKHESLTADELKEKIESIVNRGELTRTAKRKLALLKKLLRVKEGKEPLTSPKGKGQKSVEVEKNKQVQNKQQNKKLQGQLDSKSKKQNKKTDIKQANQFVKKPQTDDDEDEEDDTDSELSENESDIEEEEDEEDGENEEEVEDEEESEDDEDEDEEDENKVKTNNVQPAKEKESNKTEGEPKKKRYVVFVGNLPYSITSEELKKHFLTKVSHVVNIRIPTKDGSTSRGFAYVELADNTDFEKAFALNHSMLNGRRINVQYSGANKKEGVAKNFKLNALHKAGKFAGGKNRNQQRNFPNKRK